MDTIQKAESVIREAEEALRELIRTALVEQRYDEIKVVADMADGLAKVLSRDSESSIGSRAVRAPRSEALSPPAPRQVGRQARSGKKEKYPKFGRDGDRLVKIGWSKTSQKEYEHRVPKEAVFAFIRHLGASAKRDKVVDVDSLLPVLDASGDEIPAYQVYATLAWLRETGVVERKGRDGYVLRRPMAVDGDIEAVWKSVPARSV